MSSVLVMNTLQCHLTPHNRYKVNDQHKKVALITLGCAKNTVDSEIIASILQDAGVEICEKPDRAPVAIINTCGFIKDAKEESIDTILSIAGLKECHRLKKLVVCGCLAERYKEELEAEMPEVDIITGVNPRRTASAVLACLNNADLPKLAANPGAVRRFSLTPRSWSYLRIAEGCNNRCSYCAIPLIRGPLVSRAQTEVMDEASELIARGVKELNIIAQDTTAYCRDRGKPRLHELLAKLCDRLPGVWIRLLYTHPAHYYEELIDVIAGNKQICPYLDIPLQHINNKVLVKMGRSVKRAEIERLIDKLRDSIPSLTLRTTFMVGFPQEDQEAFTDLFNFVEKTRFERLGVFTYSPEEETPAVRWKDEVPEEIKQERYRSLMSLQMDIAFEKAAERKGEKTKILVEEQGPERKGYWTGRSMHEAPEVDPVIFVHRSEKGNPRDDIVEVKITGSEGYDCIAEQTS